MNEPLDLRPQLPSTAELMANDGKLLVVMTLRHCYSYPEYLQTNHWQDVREAAMRAARWICQMCPPVMKVRAVDAHHFRYDNLGDEQPGDVVALCRPHHTEWHERWKYQIQHEGRKQFAP